MSSQTPVERTRPQKDIKCLKGDRIDKIHYIAVETDNHILSVALEKAFAERSREEGINNTNNDMLEGVFAVAAFTTNFDQSSHVYALSSRYNSWIFIHIKNTKKNERINAQHLVRSIK